MNYDTFSNYPFAVLCPDSDLHSSEETATYAEFSLRLFINQPPY
jgi:hypothetical protein